MLAACRPNGRRCEEPAPLKYVLKRTHSSDDRRVPGPIKVMEKGENGRYKVLSTHKTENEACQRLAELLELTV